MEEVKIDELTLRYGFADKFLRIKDYLESNSKLELSNENVAFVLLTDAMMRYQFI